MLIKAQGAENMFAKLNQVRQNFSIPLPLPKPKKVGSLHATILREELTGYLFVLPAFLIILTFGLFPIGY